MSSARRRARSGIELVGVVVADPVDGTFDPGPHFRPVGTRTAHRHYLARQETRARKAKETGRRSGHRGSRINSDGRAAPFAVEPFTSLQGGTRRRAGRYVRRSTGRPKSRRGRTSARARPGGRADRDRQTALLAVVERLGLGVAQVDGEQVLRKTRPAMGGRRSRRSAARPAVRGRLAFGSARAARQSRYERLCAADRKRDSAASDSLVAHASGFSFMMSSLVGREPLLGCSLSVPGVSVQPRSAGGAHAMAAQTAGLASALKAASAAFLPARKAWSEL